MFFLKGTWHTQFNPKSTYGVVLHPWYLRRVFSFIRFIKERHRKTQPSSWRRAMGGAKESCAFVCWLPTKKAIWCSFTYSLRFRIMTGIFFRWDCSIIQYQTMCKSRVELGLVYKTVREDADCRQWQRCCLFMHDSMAGEACRVVK